MNFIFFIVLSFYCYRETGLLPVLYVKEKLLFRICKIPGIRQYLLHELLFQRTDMHFSAFPIWQTHDVARRYLQTSFDYITDGAGGMILLHPGLANPYQLVKRQQVGAMDSFEMSQQMVAGGMNGILPEEVPLHEAMCAALRGALRPELDVNDIAEDLRMLAKQNASLSEMESVLAESVTVLPTREMRDALRRLYEGTPRWLGLKAALEH